MHNGTPQEPIKVKCLSFGDKLPDPPYLSIVEKDGRQHHFEVGLTQLMLIRAQAQALEDRWRSKKPNDAA